MEWRGTGLRGRCGCRRCRVLSRRAAASPAPGTGRPGTGTASAPLAPRAPLSRGYRAGGCANPRGTPPAVELLLRPRATGAERCLLMPGAKLVPEVAAGMGSPGPERGFLRDPTMPPFSCPPPVSAARSGRSTRSSPGRSVWSVLGAVGDPSVVVDSRAAASRHSTARHGPGSADSLPGARGCFAPRHLAAPECRDGSGYTPGAPLPPRASKERFRDGRGRAPSRPGEPP